MMQNQSVKELWQLLDHWTAANYPPMLAALADPAEAHEIETLEGEIGFALPTGLRQLLLGHNGQRDAGSLAFWPEGLAFLGTADIEDRWRMLVDIESEFSDVDVDAFEEWAALAAEGMASIIGPVKALRISRRWIPFAAGARLHYFVDLNPPPGGAIAQVIRVDSESGAWCVMAPSIEDYFGALCSKLMDGTYRFDEWGPALPESERLAYYSLGSVPAYLKHVQWKTPAQRSSRLPVGTGESEVDVLVTGLSGSAEGTVLMARLADGSEMVATATRESSKVYSPRLGDLIRALLIRGQLPALDYLAGALGEPRSQFHCKRLSLLRPRHLVNKSDPWVQAIAE